MSKLVLLTLTLMLLFAVSFPACGPVPMPKGAYTHAPDLLAAMSKKRQGFDSFRISGRVDHFGKAQHIRGKLFLFAQFPKNLRVDLLSPFGNTLSVLTVADGRFAMADYREGVFMEGAAEPCNIARLIKIPLPAEEVIRILIGDSPIIEGTSEVSWDKKGFYRVEVRDGERIQTLEINPDKDILSLKRSLLKDSRGIVYDIRYDRWRRVNSAYVPYEIRVKVPSDQTDLELLYDDDGVETDIELPSDAWSLSFPKGADIKQAVCR